MGQPLLKLCNWSRLDRAPRGGRSLRGPAGGEEDDFQAASVDGGGGEGSLPAKVHEVRWVSGTFMLQTYLVTQLLNKFYWHNYLLSYTNADLL